jgi:type IV pilus assembly protein PilC
MSVIILMMVFVVPVFKKIFENVEGGLPLATQIVVNISDFLTDPIKGGLLGVSIVSVVIILLTLIKKNYKIRRSWHKFILKVPLVGDLSRKSALSKIAMIQGNLSAAGVPVLEALDIAASSNNNIIIREAMTEVKRGVFSGKPLSELYQKNPSIFEPSFVAMVAVGEKTGNMEEMFGAIANYYEEEMDVTITRLTSMLEPIMIVFMGITIGFILVAMYTPLFSIGKAI